MFLGRLIRGAFARSTKLEKSFSLKKFSSHTLTAGNRPATGNRKPATPMEYSNA
jgi:hypothetical protein